MKNLEVKDILEGFRQETIKTPYVVGHMRAIQTLSKLIGLYEAFKDPNGRKHSVVSFAEELIDICLLPVQIPYSLEKHKVKKDSPPPKIALYFNRTMKGNLTLNFELLEVDYSNINKVIASELQDAYFSGGHRPPRELAIMRDVDYVNSLASVDKLPQFTDGDRSDQWFLIHAIAQYSIKGLDVLKDKYITELSKDYEVWMKNDITFKSNPPKTATNQFNMLNKIPNGHLIQNFLINDSIELDRLNYEHPSFPDLMPQSYDALKKQAEEKVEKLTQMSNELEFYSLTVEDIIKKIKTYKRNATRTAEILSNDIKPPKNPITEEQLKKWINTLIELKPEDMKKNFGDKPPFIEITGTIKEKELQASEVVSRPLEGTMKSKISSVRNGTSTQRKSIGSRIELPGDVTIFKRTKS